MTSAPSKKEEKGRQRTGHLLISALISLTGTQSSPHTQLERRLGIRVFQISNFYSKLVRGKIYTGIAWACPHLLVHHFMWLSVLVFSCCCNKWSQIKWLKTVHVYYLGAPPIMVGKCVSPSKTQSVSRAAFLLVCFSGDSLILAQLDCWQNLLPWGCGTEDSFLAECQPNVIFSFKRSWHSLAHDLNSVWPQQWQIEPSFSLICLS